MESSSKRKLWPKTLTFEPRITTNLTPKTLFIVYLFSWIAFKTFYFLDYLHGNALNNNNKYTLNVSLKIPPPVSHKICLADSMGGTLEVLPC